MLMLGIGASTSVFSVVNGVLLTPLPYIDADRLVRIYGVWPQGNHEGTSPLDFADYRQRSTTFSSVGAAGNFSPLLNFTGSGEPEQVRGRNCTSGYFRTLGVPMLYGREFIAQEEARNGPRVVILSYGLWQRRFGGDPSVVDKTATINFAPNTIVGVLPPYFDFLGSADAWTPFQIQPIPEVRAGRILVMIGRLKPGIDLRRAQAETSGLASQLEAENPKFNKGWKVALAPLSSAVVSGVRPALLILLGAVGFVLLIVSSNIANLMLSMAAARQGEMAVRTSLGAGPFRMFRQLMTESLVLALLGGGLGCLFAVWGIQLLKNLAPSNIPRLADVRIDTRMLLFALAVSVVVGIVCALEPSYRIWRQGVTDALRTGSRATGAQNTLRNVLVISEVTLSVVLLIGAGLTIRSLVKLQKVDPGFRTSNILTARISTSSRRYTSQLLMGNFWAKVVDAVETIPEVTSAALTSEVPLGGLNNPTPRVATSPEAKDYFIYLRSVTPQYFDTMGLHLVQGRSISRDDRLDTPRVMVISESFRRDAFGDANPIGTKFALNFEGYEAVVVGVVSDIRHTSLASQPFREAYLPLAQNVLPQYNLVAHTAVPSYTIGNAVRRAVSSVDPDQSVGSILDIKDLVGRDLEQPSFRSSMLGLFAVIALLLSAVGLYGVLSCLVTQRTREIGVRLALGASPRDILFLILGKGVLLTCIGVAGGLAAAFWLARLLATLLYGIAAIDPLTFMGGPAVLILIAIFASFVPARRAMRVDPIIALRQE